MAPVWDFGRRELLPLCWAAVETALIAPLGLAFMPWAAAWPQAGVALWLLLTLLTAFNLSRAMNLLRWPLPRQQTAMAVALLLTLVVTIRLLLYAEYGLFDFGWLAEWWSHLARFDHPAWRREIVVFMLVALAWWRGIALVGRPIDIGDAGLRFRLGALLAAPLVALFGGLRLGAAITPFILLYLFAALLAMVLTRVEQLERNRIGRSYPITGRWLLVVVSAAAAVVALTAGITALLTGEPLRALAAWLGPVWAALGLLYYAVLAVSSLLISPVLIAFTWLFGQIFDLLREPLSEAAGRLRQNLAPLFGPAPVEPVEGLGGGLSLLTRQLLVGLFLLTAVLIVALLLRRQMARRLEMAAAGERSPGAGPGLSRPAGLGRRLLARLGLGRRWWAAASVRRIYQQMCWLAAEHGYPRAASETPLEYLPTLGRAWPEQRAETGLITAAYNRVRYGEIPETAAELEALRLAWQSLQAAPPAAPEAEGKDHT
ncbi:MAG: DUF4129 domain-containing protein [Candidatus Promineifilaceae bacterium]